MNESDYRAVLAERIKAARRRKFKTVDAARQAADIARGTWEKAEKGLPIKDFSLAAIEGALGWDDGYAQAILDGHDPDQSGLSVLAGESDEPRPRPKLGGMDAYLASIEDRLDSLETRMAQMENPLIAHRVGQIRLQEHIRDAKKERDRERRMSEGSDEVDDLRAADIQETPISGEQGEPDDA